MRLGQLARKLSIRPQQIVDFLAAHQITIDEGSNARLDDGHVDRIVQEFAPFTTKEEVATVKQEIELASENSPESEPDAIKEPADLISVSEIPPALTNVEEELQEVIKAPKVELQGLKVLGKIDLPELKKKPEPEIKQSASAGDETPEIGKRNASDDRRPQPYRKPKSERRTEKNPIALAREQEALDAKRKREEAAEKAKEQRAKNYQKKVKISPPTRRAKLIDEQVEEFSASDSKPAPTGFWGKIKQWFRS